MTQITVYYVDDQANDKNEARRDTVERYKERLSRGGVIRCELFSPPKWSELDNKLFNPPPDLFLIDYELMYQQRDDSHPEYRGSTLAAEIRMQYPNCPIVLITRESILEELSHQKRLEVIKRLEVFDEMLLKSELEERLELTQETLISLVNGFRQLASYDDPNWNSLIDALQANAPDIDRLREASPPLKDGKWIPITASDWIRHVILEYPGILYDSLHASVRLGITEQAFLSPEVQKIFNAAQYRGIFSEGQKFQRWWRSKLFELQEEFISDQELNSLSGSTFGDVFEKKFGEKLNIATCIWDCKPVADWVCFVLRTPVKLEHTLRYYPDNRPDVMDDARISFRAIWSTNNYEQNLLDATGLELLEKIENLQDPCKSI